jgi:hypothetical protein
MFGSRKPADLLVLVGNFLGVVKGDPVQGGRDTYDEIREPVASGFKRRS